MNNKSHFSFFVLMMICCGIGIAGGWFAASQTQSHAAHGDGHADEGAHGSHDDHAGHEGHGAHSEGSTESHVISVQAQETMGIMAKEAELTTFWKTQTIAAKTLPTVDSQVSIAALTSGTVKEILVSPGEAISPGQPMLRVLRDAYGRPSISVIKEILDQDVVRILIQRHATKQSSADLLKTLSLPTELDKKLSKMSTNEVRAVLYRHMLERAGFWTEQIASVYSHMPAVQQLDPLAVASLAELGAVGGLHSDMIGLLKANTAVAKNLPDVLSLYQMGYDAAQLSYLVKAGYLASSFYIKAPDLPNNKTKSDVNFDVTSIAVSKGQRFEAGDVLVELMNMSELLLEAAPVGHEIASIKSALKQKQPAVAKPMIIGAGPSIGNVVFQNMQAGVGGQAIVRSVVKNTVTHTSKNADGQTFRTWSILPGLPYQIYAPTEKLEDVFVVPADAVITQGTDQIVYLKSGNTFEPVKVVLKYRDDRFAVLGENSEIFEGDPVVVKGAFSLDLAIKAASGQGVDPHAGHNH